MLVLSVIPTLVAALLTAGGQADVVITPSNPALRYVGRFDVTEVNAPRFDMNGCEIQFSVRGASSLGVKLSQRLVTPIQLADNPTTSQIQHFLVFIDGTAQPRSNSVQTCAYCTFGTRGAANDTIHEHVIATNLTEGVHNIRIVKTTEPEWNDASPTQNWVTFHGLWLNAGSVQSMSFPPRSRRIEFIGDSITAGYCNLCQDYNGSNAAIESYALAWPFLMCEQLDAECHTLAWSGMGLVRNCCGGSTHVPKVWERSVATDSHSAWNFSRWTPDAVVINLGTNDGTDATSDGYLQAYIDLAHQAFSYYGKSLNLFLACGPMSEIYCAQVHKVIDNVTASGIKAHFFDQRGFLNGTSGPACCGHPSAQVDRAMAMSGAGFIGHILGWEEMVIV